MQESGIEKTVIIPLRDLEKGMTMEEQFQAVEEFIKSGKESKILLKLQKKRIDHTQVLEAVKKYPYKFMGFYWINPWLGKEVLGEAEKLVREEGFKGFKLQPVSHGFPANHEIVYPVMELAIELDIPVLFHTGFGPGTECERIGELGKKFPEAKIIMGHAGIQMQTKKAIRIARENKNIFLEISGTAPMAVKWIVEEAPPERILFGSDGPYGHPYVQLAKLETAKPSPRIRNLILRENALRLLRL